MLEMWVQPLGWGDTLEKKMVTHSSILAWEIPCTEEAGGLQSMGSQKSWAWLSHWTSMVAHTVKHLSTVRETQVRSLGQEDPLEKEMAPTPVLLPGKSHGWRSLVGYSPWGLKESDTTEQLHFHFHLATKTTIYLSTLYFMVITIRVLSFLGCASGKESACQCRRLKRCRFDPWIGKIP